MHGKYLALSAKCFTVSLHSVHSAVRMLQDPSALSAQCFHREIGRKHSVHSVHYRKLCNGKNAGKDQAVGSEKSLETHECNVQKHVSFEALLGLQQFEKQVRLLSHACCALRHQTRWLELLAVRRTFGHLELFERGLDASSRCAIFKVWQAGMDERRRSVLRKSDGASSDAFVTVLSHDGVQLAFCLI